MRRLHPRAFTVSVVWTLILLWLGSIVHATQSSLACPDWPTCHGTMVPVMTGGIFWEHLHRLVAGGLVLMWILSTWIARNETRDRPWIFKAALAGVALLVVQAVFGGITVIFRLPPLVSTTHLALAMGFLALATTLASRTGWAGEARTMSPEVAAGIRRYGLLTALLVFVQIVLGGLVRHLHAGMACPDAPLCLGQVIPPMDNHLVALQFTHRVVAVLVALATLGLATWALKIHAPPVVKVWASWAAVLVLVQIALGFISVLTALAVVPVSVHTLVAASIMAVLVHLTALGWSARTPAPAEAEPASTPA
jgi:heme A synthase